MDASAGEAIVRCAGRWYRVYRRKYWWYPDDLGVSEPSELRWSTSLMKIRRDFPSFVDLVAALASVASSGATSPEEVRSAFRRAVGGIGRNAGSAWADEFLWMFQGRLDGLLARRGCSAEGAFPLILETFRRAYLLGSMDAETLQELLPQIAIDVFREKYGDVARPRVPRRDPSRTPIRTVLDESLQERLAGLDSLTLRCLALCSDPRPRSSPLTKEGMAAKLFALQEEDMHLRLGLAAARLGCSRDHLLSPAMHEAYKRELSRRLD